MQAGGIANRCIFCHGALPANEAVERFRLGRRIAFDPARGRLWAVCPTCSRWNLAPFEDRWEALEELEKTGRDAGRVLASTPNIALIRVPGVELVRVGAAPLGEEAWWRYGSQLIQRRRRARVLRWSEQALAVGATMATGGFFYLFMGGDGLNNLLRWRQFGSTAWRGEVRCVQCGAALTGLSFKAARRLHLSRGSADDLALHLQCTRCRLRRRGGEFQIEGAAARHVLRRVVTYNHYRGASAKRVQSAADYIERRGTPEAVTRELMSTGLRIDALLDRHRRTEAVALEISLNEENERRLLQMEVRELEARWREEEEIAAIVDGELTDVTGVAALRRGVGRQDTT
jgi:hypothetical protein